MRKILGMLAACLISAVAAQAAVVQFGSDLLNESNSINGTNVIINAHPAWGSLAPYLWISYADTGSPGSVSPPNTTIPGSPTAIFWESLPSQTFSVQVKVFADDTADVYLYDLSHPTGLLLKAANPVQDGACAAGPIGCEPAEGWTSGLIAVDAAAPANLEFRVYQRGGGPFGLLYGGTAETVPEPGTYAMLGAGLLAVGYLARRKKA